MRTTVNATVSFGLLNIPVGVASATTEKDQIKFKTLHAECLTPIKQEKICVTCNADELTTADLVSGYEYAKGKFVVVTDEEKRSVAPERSPIITINKFVSADEIDPLWVKKSHWLVPNTLSSSSYSLFLWAMIETKLVGLGFAALWGKESPVVVAGEENASAMMLYRLHTADEIVHADFAIEMWTDAKKRKTARETLLAYKDDVETSDLVSAPKELLKSLIASKVAGEEFSAPDPEPEPLPTVDPLAAFEEMLRERNKAMV